LQIICRFTPNGIVNVLKKLLKDTYLIPFQVIPLLCLSEAAYSGWKNKPTQYHIQTDEGKSRYFRYQTYNGQYRKERRLDDGTVVGSYGWVDPTGMLRMTDYIADSKGYRVVKELMEYVGTNAITTDEPKKKKKYYVPPKKKPVRGAKYPFFSSSTVKTTVVPPTVESVTPLNKIYFKTTPSQSWEQVPPLVDSSNDIVSANRNVIRRHRMNSANGTKAILVRRRVSSGNGGIKFVNRRPAPVVEVIENNDPGLRRVRVFLGD